MIQLPEDVVERIILENQELQGVVASKIQRWWKTYRQCDDCRRFRKKEPLEVVPACAGYQVIGTNCCVKQICRIGCIFYCERGHLNMVRHNNGYGGSAVHRKWLGLPPSEVRGQRSPKNDPVSQYRLSWESRQSV